MYKLFINAINVDERHLITGIMDTTADDELNDHMAHLVEKALAFGYDVPSTINEFKKYAGEEDSKAFETIKTKKDADVYLKLSVESEIRAIKSYEEALNIEDFHAICPELYHVVESNYYDEVEHFHQFSFLLKTLDVEADVEILQQGHE